MIPASLKLSLIDKPSMSSAPVREVFSVSSTLTPTQVTAGTNLIAPGHEVSLRPLSVTLIVGAAALTGVTLLRLVTTDATPVVIASWAVADLTTGAKFSEVTATTTLGAGFLAALGRGVGVKVDKTGGSAAGATTVQFRVDFDIIG